MSIRRRGANFSLVCSLCWRADRRTFIHVIAIEAIAGLLVALQLLLAGALVRALGDAQDRHDAVAAVAPLLAALIASMTFTAVARLYARAKRELLTELVDREATLRLIDAITGAELLAFEGTTFFDVIERAGTSGSIRALQVVNGAGALAMAVSTSAAVLATLTAVAPAVVPLIVCGGAPLLYSAVRNNVAYYQFVRGITLTERRRNYFAELLTRRDAAAEIRAYDLAPFFQDAYRTAQDAVIRALRESVRRRLRRSIRGELLAAMILTGALALVGWLFVDGRLSVEALVIVLLGLTQLRSAFTELAFQAGELHEAVLLLSDFSELTAAPETTTPSRRERLETLQLTGVSFRYPGLDRDVLSGVTLTIERGEVVGIVGDNGSGKTTLAKILAGLYPPTAGEIAWNGSPFTAGSDEIALLPQDFGRYWITAGENVGFDRILGGQLRTVAQAAGAQELIDALPDGFETALGKPLGGLDLSIGQWQRMALARAFARDASLVILDEPTAALDPRAEAEMYRRAGSLFRDRGVVLIAHRLGAVRHADRIIVLHNGAIVEQGPPADLLAAGGHFAELVALQASGLHSAAVVS